MGRQSGTQVGRPQHAHPDWGFVQRWILHGYALVRFHIIEATACLDYCGVCNWAFYLLDFRCN